MNIQEENLRFFSKPLVKLPFLVYFGIKILHLDHDKSFFENFLKSREFRKIIDKNAMKSDFLEKFRGFT